MKYFLLITLLLGAMIPLACNNYVPTGSYSSRNSNQPTSTPTNLNGWTSTPTATLQATPAFVNTFTANAPNGIAYANSLIYVAEGDGASVSQVQVFNSSSNALSWTWTNSGGTNFEGPNGVAVNAAGTTVYVLDAGDETNNYQGIVYALAPAATPTPITAWTSYSGKAFSAPGGIALDSTGNVYVADTDNEQVDEFGPTGTTIASWFDRGVEPVAVAVDSTNHVYVADGHNAKVWVLTPSGSSFTVTTSWSLPFISNSVNEGEPDFYGLALDSSNNVYVADYFNSQVEVYTSAGIQIGVFDGNQAGATPLTGPDALLLFNNDIYVADYDSNSFGASTAGIIEVFGPNTY